MKAVAPLAAEVTRENRQFLAGAVTWAANQGITQFIDLGCCMPTAPNTHETARAISRAQVYNHSVPDFASFFGPLELVPPGVVDARDWRPGWEQAVHLAPRDGQVIVGVARVG